MNHKNELMEEKTDTKPVVSPEGWGNRSGSARKGQSAFSSFSAKMKKALVFMVLALLCAAASACSPAANGEPTPSGADVFRQYYAEKTENDPENDYSYMDLGQLDSMASSTVGTVVDTDELTIEVLGAIMSGNIAEIRLRVTAKALDSVFYDNGMELLKNYRFSDEIAPLMFDLKSSPDSHGATISYDYILSDEDSSLAPNQFILSYSIFSKEELDKEQYTIGLTDFGYYEQTNQFVTVYSGVWQFPVAFDPASDSSKIIPVDREITVGGYRCTIDDGSPL